MKNPVFAILEVKDKKTGLRWNDITEVVENEELSGLLSSMFTSQIEFTSKIYDANTFDRETMAKELFT